MTSSTLNVLPDQIVVPRPIPYKPGGFTIAHKVGFALSGGGSKGDFQIGALRYLYDHGVFPDVICGTSVGALNGAALAQGPQGNREAFDQLEKVWLGLQQNSDMFLEEDWYKNLPSEAHALFSNIASLLVPDSGYQLIPFFGVINTILAIKNLNDVVNGINDALHAKSMYNLNPTAKLVQDLMDPAKVKASGIQLRLGMVSLESGDLQFVTESGELLPAGAVTGKGQPVDLSTATLASASIPFVFPPQKLGAGDNFVDGGVREITPIEPSVKLLTNIVGKNPGFSRDGKKTLQVTYAIVCTKAGVARQNSFDAKNIVDIAMRAAEDIMPSAIQDLSTNPFNGWGADVRVIQPTLDPELHDFKTIDPGLISISIDYGYMRAFDVIAAANNADFLSSSDNISSLRKEIWDEEFDVNGELKPGEVIGDHLQKVPAFDALPDVRQKKKQLKQLVTDRQALAANLQGDPVPPYVANWWKQWERHNWQPLTQTPWDEFDTVAGNTPAEQSP